MPQKTVTQAPSFRYWEELTSPDFAALDPEKTLALLPLGAIEQHGPHLPLSVDSRLSLGILEKTLSYLERERTGEPFQVLVLPLQAIGWSDEHRSFPGTLSIAPETLIAAWEAIGHSVHRAGLRKLCFLNSHGGQPQLIDIVARRLRKDLGMLAVRANWWQFGLPETSVSPEEQKLGLHAGAIETAMMLHLEPALVKKDKLQNFVSRNKDYRTRYKYLAASGPTPFAWLAEDLNLEGAVGDARLATAELGAALVEHAARGLARLLAEMADFPLSNLQKDFLPD